MKINNKWNNWISNFSDKDEARKVMEHGLLLGLKHHNGKLLISNFERGIILRKITREKTPKNILELGTGRGFGSICMADCIKAEKIDATIKTIDCIHENEKQKWPYQKNGLNHTDEISLKSFWEKEYGDLNKLIKRYNGKTSDIIQVFLKNAQRFDFIFMDAAHDFKSVYLDLAGSISVLNSGGSLLMDDYAPTESFGLATCIAVNHAKEYFDSIEIINSDGAIFDTDNTQHGFRRSMVFLEGRNNRQIRFNPKLSKILILRLAGRLLDWMYSPSSFKF
jgi:predicted O-methyltransferase YrrM